MALQYFHLNSEEFYHLGVLHEVTEEQVLGWYSLSQDLPLKYPVFSQRVNDRIFHFLSVTKQTQFWVHNTVCFKTYKCKYWFLSGAISVLSK